MSYCGLSTELVNTGFQRDVKRIVTRDGTNKSKLQAARNRAMTLVELEWSNRGPGGFRRWCQIEGTSAAHRFLMPSQ